MLHYRYPSGVSQGLRTSWHPLLLGQVQAILDYYDKELRKIFESYAAADQVSAMAAKVSASTINLAELTYISRLKWRRPSQTTAPREPPRRLRRLRARLSKPEPPPGGSDAKEASWKATREGSQNEAWPF